jgi:hypothetical protein
LASPVVSLRFGRMPAIEAPAAAAVKINSTGVAHADGNLPTHEFSVAFFSAWATSQGELSAGRIARVTTRPSPSGGASPRWSIFSTTKRSMEIDRSARIDRRDVLASIVMNQPADGIRHKVVTDHEPSYPDPIAMHTGDRVKLGKRDPENPGWIWCTAADGKAGWVPEAYLDVDGDVGIARRDYSAVELWVRVEEEVAVTQEESGWCWVTSSSGESGWVPRSKLSPVEQGCPR